jgi:hypothetical protein
VFVTGNIGKIRMDCSTLQAEKPADHHFVVIVYVVNSVALNIWLTRHYEIAWWSMVVYIAGVPPSCTPQFKKDPCELGSQVNWLTGKLAGPFSSFLFFLISKVD